MNIIYLMTIKVVYSFNFLKWALTVNTALLREWAVLFWIEFPCIPKCYNTDCVWIVSLIFKPVSTVATSLYGFVMLSWEIICLCLFMFVDAYENIVLISSIKFNKILFWFPFIEFTYKEKVGGRMRAGRLKF